MRAIVLTEIPNRRDVWWEKYLRPYIDDKKIIVDIESKPDIDASLLSVSTFILLIRLTIGYLWRYRGYNFIITFQSNLSTAWIGILKRIIKRHNQKHVVLQFNRKEKNNSLPSRFRYFVLQYALKSTSRIICHSKGEVVYYSKTLSLPEDKFKFIPLCADPNLLAFRDNNREGNYIISAGKTLRDYEVLIKAIETIDIDLLIVSDKQSIEYLKMPSNVQVLNDIPYWELNQLIAGSMLVVIPLQDRLMSTGQSVLLAAMALGKATIITKTSGTVDYVLDNVTGVLVDPYNHIMLRNKIVELVKDKERTRRIGARAQEFIKENYTIQKYLETVWCELVKLNSRGI